MSEKMIVDDANWDGPVMRKAGTTDLWDLQKLQIMKLWTQYGRGEGCNVYVIDSGFADHHAFKHHPQVKAMSFMDEDRNPEDGNGHGTWVCGKSK